MTEKLLSRDPLTDLRRAFKLFDVDGTGVINLRDLRRVAKELGESLGEEELWVFSIPSSPANAPFISLSMSSPDLHICDETDFQKSDD